MNFAKIRARLEAIDNEYSVHVHGCFGEVIEGYCHGCERTVPLSAIVSPYPTALDYEKDVTALLLYADKLEEENLSA